MKANKVIWQKPELVVLVRSRPEEAVLKGCKTSGRDGPDVIGCMSSGQGRPNCKQPSGT